MTSAFRRDCSFPPSHRPAGFDSSLISAATAFPGFQGSEASNVGYCVAEAITYFTSAQRQLSYLS